MSQSLMSKDRSVLSRTVKTLLLGLAATSLPLTAATASTIKIGDDVALTTAPGELYVNGVSAGNMASARIDPGTGHIWITGDMSVGDGGGYGGPIDDPEDPPVTPDPPVNPGNGSCDQWVPSRPQELVAYSSTFTELGNEVKSYEFTAQEGVKTLQASYSSLNPVAKVIWVSHCPGGEPVDTSLISEGYQTASVRYGGGNQESGPYILAGETYYFNVMNARMDSPSVNTCKASNCPFIPKIH